MKLLIYQMVLTHLLIFKIIYFYIIKKHKTITLIEESPILIYPNKIKNRTVFKIKIGYKLKLLNNETMRLLGDGPIIDTYKNGVYMSQNVLLHCNVVQNDYLQNRKLVYTFVPSNYFG